MTLNFRSRWAKPPPLDVDAVAASADLGTFSEVACEHIRTWLSLEWGQQSSRRGLLETDALALLAWRREPHVHVFDRAGIYRAIVPVDRRRGVVRAMQPTLHFMDGAEPHFSMTWWHSTSTNVIGGSTAAQVSLGREGEVIGLFDQERNEFLHGWQRVRALNILGAYNQRGRVWSADRQLLGFYRPSGDGVELVSPQGESLARVVGHFRSTGAVSWVRIVEFSPGVSPNVRAVTLAGEVCRQIQWEADDRVD